jgi:predicted translin family RNA/ssDNA-binding protein
MLIFLRRLVQYFPVTNSDYILGLSDLSGELMRYTLNGSSR